MAAAAWRIALASAVGASHVASGTPCQDSAAHRIIATDVGEVLVAAVSDGAGSAPRSDLGSRVATETFIACVETYFREGRDLAGLDRETACGWVEDTATALVAAAKAEGRRVRDLACTLLAAIVGEDAAAFVQVGDGAIVVSHGEEDGWSYVFWPQHGEFANTTNFITGRNATEVMEFDLAKRRITELAMFSDGLENLLLQRSARAVHQPFFRQMFPPVRNAAAEGHDVKLSAALGRYLQLPHVCARTDDDKTLVLATRRPPPNAGASPNPG